MLRDNEKVANLFLHIESNHPRFVVHMSDLSRKGVNKWRQIWVLSLVNDTKNQHLLVVPVAGCVTLFKKLIYFLLKQARIQRKKCLSMIWRLVNSQVTWE